VLSDVCEGLRDGEVDRGFGGGRGALARHPQLDRDGRARGKALERDREAAHAQRRRVDPAGKIAEFGQSPLDLFERVGDEPFRWRAARLCRGQSQRQGGGDELLLRAVVQIALQSPPGLIGRSDESRPRRLDLRPPRDRGAASRRPA
jgi:hypothetical protein